MFENLCEFATICFSSEAQVGLIFEEKEKECRNFSRDCPLWTDQHIRYIAAMLLPN
jgi:hypothetical protein